MSFFDTLTVDKTTIVLDIGTKYTKLGCAGEFNPRIIIPTVVKCPNTGRVRSVYSYKNEQDLSAMLVEFIHTIYFKHILISPKDKQVVIVESLLSQTKFKHTLAKVLFYHFEVGIVLFVPSQLVSLYALGVKTALVIDVGYNEAQVVPVYELVPVLNAWQAQPIAAQAVETRLKEGLKETVNNIINEAAEAVQNHLPNIEDLSDSDIEDIKVRACFVTTVERGKLLALSQTLPPPHPPQLDYKIKGDHILPVPGQLRESVYEPLFEKDNDNLSLPNLILDSILKCSMDSRKPLAENMLVVGGTSMALGFKSRLMQELRELLATPYYHERLPLTTIKFHNPPAKDNYVAWLGGSLVGATDIVQMKGLSREKYMALQDVPDWSNLAYNELYLSKLSL